MKRIGSDKVRQFERLSRLSPPVACPMQGLGAPWPQLTATAPSRMKSHSK